MVLSKSDPQYVTVPQACWEQILGTELGVISEHYQACPPNQETNTKKPKDLAFQVKKGDEDLTHIFFYGTLPCAPGK